MISMNINDYNLSIFHRRINMSNAQNNENCPPIDNNSILMKKYQYLTSPLSNLQNIKEADNHKKDLKKNLTMRIELMKNTSKTHQKQSHNNSSVSFAQLKATASIYKIPQFCTPQINYEVADKIKKKVQEMKNEIMTHLPQISKSSNYAPKKIDHQINHRSAVIELEEWLKFKLKNPPVNHQESLQYKNMIMGVGMKQLIRIVSRRCLEEGKIAEQIWQLTWSICQQIIVYLSKRAKKCQQILDQQIRFLKSNYDHQFERLKLSNAQYQQRNTYLEDQNKKLSEEINRVKKKNQTLTEENKIYFFDNYNLQEQFKRVLEENLAIYLQAGDRSKRQWVKKMYKEMKSTKSYGEGDPFKETFKKTIDCVFEDRKKVEDAAGDETPRIQEPTLEEIQQMVEAKFQKKQKKKKNKTKKLKPAQQNAATQQGKQEQQQIEQVLDEEQNEQQQEQVQEQSESQNEFESVIKNLHDEFKSVTTEMQTDILETTDTCIQAIQTIQEQGFQINSYQIEQLLIDQEMNTDEVIITVKEEVKPKKKPGNKDSAPHKQKQSSREDQQRSVKKERTGIITKTKARSQKKTTTIQTQNDQKIHMPPQIILKDKEKKISQTQNETRFSGFRNHQSYSALTNGASSKNIIQNQQSGSLQAEFIQQCKKIIPNFTDRREVQQLLNALKGKREEFKAEFKTFICAQCKQYFEEDSRKSGNIVRKQLKRKDSLEQTMNRQGIELRHQRSSFPKRSPKGSNHNLNDSDGNIDVDYSAKKIINSNQIAQTLLEEGEQNFDFDLNKSALKRQPRLIKKRNSGYMHDIAYKKQFQQTQKSSFHAQKKDTQDKQDNQVSNFKSMFTKINFFKYLNEKMKQANAEIIGRLVPAQKEVSQNLDHYFEMVVEINSLPQGKMNMTQKSMCSTIQKTIFPIMNELMQIIKKACKNNKIRSTMKTFTSLPSIVYNRISRKYGMKILAVKNLKNLLMALKYSEKITEKYKMIELMMFTDCKSPHSEDLFIYLLVMGMLDPSFSSSRIVTYEEAKIVRSLCEEHLTKDRAVYQEYQRLTREEVDAEGADSHFHGVSLLHLIKSIITSYRLLKIQRIEELGFIYLMLKKDLFLDYKTFLYFLATFSLESSIKIEISKKLLEYCDYKGRNNTFGISENMFSKFLMNCEIFTLQLLIKTLNNQTNFINSISNQQKIITAISKNIFSTKSFKQPTESPRQSIQEDEQNILKPIHNDKIVITDGQMLQNKKKSLKIVKQKLNELYLLNPSHRTKLQLKQDQQYIHERINVSKGVKEHSMFTYQICEYLQNQDETRFLSERQRAFIKDYLIVHILQSELDKTIGLLDYLSSSMMDLICTPISDFQIADTTKVQEAK